MKGRAGPGRAVGVRNGGESAALILVGIALKLLTIACKDSELTYV